MPKSLLKHLNTVAVKVHVSLTYRKIEMTKENIGLILELRPEGDVLVFSYGLVL